MKRRDFFLKCLVAVGSLPFLGWLKPKAKTSIPVSVEWQQVGRGTIRIKPLTKEQRRRLREQMEVAWRGGGDVVPATFKDEVVFFPLDVESQIRLSRIVKVKKCG